MLRIIAMFGLLSLAVNARSSTDAAIFITGMLILLGLARANRHG